VTTGLRKLGGFGCSTLASALVGLVTIPFIVAFAGPLVWGGLVVAQSVAGITTVLVAFGWGVMGPVRIAASRYEDRGQLYADSLVFRLLLLILVLPLTVALVGVWAPGNKVANMCAGTAMVIVGTGGSWFYVGEGTAWRLFAVDTIPRCSGTLIGTLLLGFTADATYFAVGQVAGSVLAVSLAATDILRRHKNYRWRKSIDIRRLTQGIKEQFPGVLTAAASSLYSSAPLAILAGSAPAGVPVYAIAQKITSFADGAMSPLTQLAQSSVPSPDTEKQKQNIVLATKVSAAAAVTAGLLLALAMPSGSKLLSAGKIEVPIIISSAFGLALAAIVFSEICGLVSLMCLGCAKTVAASLSFGVCVVVPLVFALASLWGAAGAAWGLCVSGLAVALFQFAALTKALKREPTLRSAPRSTAPTRNGYH
jgi:O-antigen/teichoic acid export membrane protein